MNQLKYKSRTTVLFCEEISHFIEALLNSYGAPLLSLFCVFCHSQSLSLFIFLFLSLAHTFLQDMHIISTDEKQVFAAVQEWNQNNTYSLYISDSPGVYFTLSLENLRTSRGPAGNLLVDFYKVCIQSPSWAADVITQPVLLQRI